MPSFTELVALAEHDSTAAYLVGVCYANGKGVEQDVHAGVSWLKRAAEDGMHDGARTSLAIITREGLGDTPKDPVMAIGHLREAAGIDRGGVGDWHAKFQLGLMMEEGVAVEKDLKTAFKYYQEAGQDGDVAAIVKVGTCYELGTGVKQSFKMALEWCVSGGVGRALRVTSSCCRYARPAVRPRVQEQQQLQQLLLHHQQFGALPVVAAAAVIHPSQTVVPWQPAGNPYGPYAAMQPHVPVGCACGLPMAAAAMSHPSMHSQTAVNPVHPVPPQAGMQAAPPGSFGNPRSPGMMNAPVETTATALPGMPNPYTQPPQATAVYGHLPAANLNPQCPRPEAAGAPGAPGACS